MSAVALRAAVVRGYEGRAPRCLCMFCPGLRLCYARRAPAFVSVVFVVWCPWCSSCGVQCVCRVVSEVFVAWCPRCLSGGVRGVCRAVSGVFCRVVFFVLRVVRGVCVRCVVCLYSRSGGQVCIFGC